MTSTHAGTPESLHDLKVKVAHEGKALKQDSGKLRVADGGVELKKFIGSRALFRLDDVIALEHRGQKVTLRTKESFWVFEFPGKKDADLRAVKECFAAGFGLTITGDPKAFVLETEHLVAGGILVVAVIAGLSGVGGGDAITSSNDVESEPKDGMVVVDKEGVIRRGNAARKTPAGNLTDQLNAAVTESSGIRLKTLVSRQPEVLTMTTIGGCDSALHIAAMVGEVGNAGLLLAKGTPANIVGCHKNTPLHVAAGYCGRLEFVDLLLKNGADPNLPGDVGDRPLHTAASDGCLPMVKMLVKAGAKVNVKNDLDETALSQAAGAVATYLRSRGGKE